MTGRIELWQRKYRVRGPATHRRLDALAAGPVLAAYEDALQQAFCEGPECVFVRTIDLRLSACLTAAGEAAVARKWGEAMAGAVLRAVADGADSADVVRYPDAAAHLAAFLAEVADGRPADDWFFARFAPFLRPTPGKTVRAALLAHTGRCLPILRRLSESRSLARVLTLLDHETAARLWSSGGTDPAAQTLEALRPLFAAALSLIADLGSASSSRDQVEAWFADFRSGARTPADWRDRTKLAEAVLAAVQFLLARVPLPRPPAAAAVEAAVAGLDWLDADWLKSQLLAWTARPPRADTPSAPAAVHGGPTARQRQWLQALADVLPRIRRDLDVAELGSPRNLLLTLATLSESHPAWADDPAVAAFVEMILDAAAVSRGGRAGDGERRPAGEGRTRAALSTAELVRSLGEQAVALVRELAGRTVSRVSDPADISTGATGAFLLLRAANDLRLVMLARPCEFPTADPDGPRWLLAALVARWAGMASASEDEGLRLLAGITAPDDEVRFRAAWACDPAKTGRFQQALARVLLGHRLLLTSNRLRVAVLPRPGEGWLVLGGDDSTQVWPFAAPVESSSAVRLTVARWAAEWQTLTGGVPTFTVPPSLAGLPADCPTELSDEVPAHLAATLESLGAGSVGDPWADATLGAAAQAVVRTWARWLKGLGTSSTPYLLGQFIRRPGRLVPDGDTLLVELAPRPVDVVLDLSGYLEPVDLLPGSGFRTVRFRIRGPA